MFSPITAFISQLEQYAEGDVITGLPRDMLIDFCRSLPPAPKSPGPSRKRGKETPEEIEEAPDGWTGPYLKTMLYGKPCRGEDGKHIRFKYFEDAIEAAESHPTCKGITRFARGYELRDSTDVRTGKYAQFATWTKTSEAPPALLANYTQYLPSEHPDYTEPETESEPEPESPVAEPVAEPVEEPEPEEESDDEDDGPLDVEEIDLNGVTYYFCEADGRLFDTLTQEHVGNYDPANDTDTLHLF